MAFALEDLLMVSNLPFAAALVFILWKLIGNHYKHIVEQGEAQGKMLAVISQTLLDHSQSDATVFAEIVNQSRLVTVGLSKLNDNIIRIEERTRH